jgi:outer membrane protein
LSIADYRGSAEYRTRLLPIPYLHYDSQYLKADRRGVRGEIMESDRIEFNISLHAALTGENDENRLRHDMPGLDSTFEIGPALGISLRGNLEDGWLAYFPVRAVIAFDKDSIRQIGMLLQPQLAYRHPFDTGWYFTYNAGTYYGNNDYHDYYYSVAPRYVTAARPAYEASSGYSGFSTQANLTRRYGDFWYGGFLRYDNLEHAVFENSPLVETTHYLMLGFGISRVFSP